ncbi:hypothetical protein [Gallibacterium genomosp. 1]|uniref:Uncharacterized protein n=1 Tax=Gallibacterium genomosp. 1 TaxID=155515 RepID=A0A0A2YLM5_9PAST|nr:hypothetical protein [Gallibacterium genomosp. 1]KGQ38214.1 hypothetical protein JP36_03495 [Gallibacterium genomosp. 1]
MSNQEESKIKVIGLSILPIFILALADFFLLMEKPVGESIISHLLIAVLVAQMISQLIFIKGEICNGQRSRLSRWNLYFLIFWGGWLLVTCFQVQVYLPIRLAYCCGLAFTLTTWQQPKEEQLRRAILWLGVVIGIIGLILALIPLFLFELQTSLTFNPLLQVVLGITLAYWGLLVSHNRLNGLIEILPYFVLIALVASSIFALVAIAIIYIDGVKIDRNILHLSFYFICHLLLLAGWAYPIIRKEKAYYWLLLIMILLSAFSPILLF